MEKSKKIYPLKFEQGTEVLDENAVVTNGFLAENTVDDIIDTYLGDLVGNDIFQYYKGEFPLKVSYITPDVDMPLQAHPNDMTALERYDALGCAKIWYVVEADANARICVGFNKEMDASRFYEGCINGTLEDDLNFITPLPGDCIYIKPGTVYAAVGKIKVVEIAQNSRVTYHLYDMAKKSSGKAALKGNAESDYQMEVAEAIDVVDYAPFDADRYLFRNINGNITIADTSDFIVKMNLLGSGVGKVGGDCAQVEISPESLESFVALLCLKGSATVKAPDGSEYDFAAGEFVLLPANMEQVAVSAVTCSGPETSNNGQTLVLQAYMPQFADQEDLYMNYYEDESGYPEGSGLDPEDDECDDDCCCDDDCSDEHDCGCGSEHHECHGHHHEHHHEHHHHHTTDNYFAQNPNMGPFTQKQSNDDMFDLEKIHREEKERGADNSNERFFRR